MDQETKKNIAVIFGGKSVEREVSIITGLQVINNLNVFKNEVLAVYIDENGDWFTGEKLKDIVFYKSFNKKEVNACCLIPNSSFIYKIKKNKLKPIKKIDCIINACHGTGGEDGCLAGIINSSGITLASPGVLAGSVSMDKESSKIFFKGLELNILPYFSFTKEEFEGSKTILKKKAKEMDYPLIVKPCSLGSSVGVSAVKNEKALIEAMRLAYEFDSTVIIEKMLTNFDEFFCSAYGKKGEVIVSEVEKMTGCGNFLTFEDKYEKESKIEFPAKIDKELKDEICNTTKQIFEAFKCLGIIRVDYLFDKSAKQLYVNEANVVPGSLAFQFWKNKLNFSDLLEKNIEIALKENKNKPKFVFKSNVLENFENAGKTKLNKV